MNPSVPLRIEIVVELPGTPEQVWDAIATGNGISSWFLRTDLDEREGGEIVTHMGESASSPGIVTGWDPPRRLAYEEPGWAALGGHEGADVTPLATEFLVEAASGGSCVLRIVSSAYGTGADWEKEFFDEMEAGWRPYFDRLRLYLELFPGQRVTLMELEGKMPGAAGAVIAAMREELGITGVGQTVEVREIVGRVERDAPNDLLVQVAAPVPGFLAFLAYDTGDGATAAIQGQFFSPDAAAFVARERGRWQSWLEGLGARTG